MLAYDAGTIPFAARLVWMLRYYGHAEAYVLAGGFPAWVAAGYPVKTDVPVFAPATFTPRPNPALRATRDEVLAIADGRSATQLLETQRDQTYAQRDRDITNAVRLSGNLLLEDARGGRVADRRDARPPGARDRPRQARAHGRQLRQRRLGLGRLARAARSRLR